MDRKKLILPVFFVLSSALIIFFALELLVGGSHQKYVEERIRKELQKTPIYYLKTHKTGSSTLFNIIYRLAITYNLKIGFPKYEKDNYICKHKPFEKDCITQTSYEIIANHHVWSPVVDQVLPNATKITILREPVSQIVSAFQYFGPRIFSVNGVPNEQSFEKFINATAPSSGKAAIRENTHNPMAFDLGLSAMYIYKSEEELADWLVDYYDLVMITEYFDESLILLKDLLSLEFSDIAYLKSNENSNSKKTFLSSDLSEKTKQQAYLLDRVDNALYKKANETFWEKIKLYGFEKMKQEKEAFRFYCAQIDEDDYLMNFSEWEFIYFMRDYQKDENDKKEE
ncbi:unnamed protein product [Oikopleura dioica]|uniref:Sulfotransferase n=1 Tax=Oikopleura dioica TaxID=34765 RepID=E4Z4H9_OIKDI|nr:unnamed protein product [Oikopleura dioica]